MRTLNAIEEATALHALMLDASGIRQEDIDEWVGGVGGPVLPAIIEALEIPGSRNEAFLRDGVVLCLWGTHPTQRQGVGQVWFIATKAAERHVLDIHRRFTAVIEGMHEDYATLMAYTHPRNVVHHKWMARHGFKLLPHRFITRVGIPYLTYRRTQA